MRSNRRFAAAAARTLRGSRGPCANRFSVRAWSARACDAGAAAVAKRRFDRIAAQCQHSMI
eukprot:10293794-Lingulodinium_polyedra.AAC.1